MGVLTELYGANAYNLLLVTVFEFLPYFLAGLLGSITREFLFYKDKKISRVLSSSLLTATSLFIVTSFIKVDTQHLRITFGIGTLFGFYTPNMMKAKSSGKIVKYVARIFSSKLYSTIKEFEEDEKNSSKDQE